METLEITEEQKLKRAHEYVEYQLLYKKQAPAAIRGELLNQGFDEESACNLVDNVLNNSYSQIRDEERRIAKKNMMVGAAWCIGGTILTLANIGFIFWGAIVFGGIQFIKGAINYK